MKKLIKKIMFVLLAVITFVSICFFGRYYYMKAEAFEDLKTLINKFPDNYFVPLAKEYADEYLYNNYFFDYFFKFDKYENNMYYLEPVFYDEVITEDEKLYNNIGLTPEEIELFSFDQDYYDAEISFNFDLKNSVLYLSDNYGNYYSKTINVTFPSIDETEYNNAKNVYRNLSYDYFSYEDVLNSDNNPLDFNEAFNKKLSNGYSFKLFGRLGGYGFTGGSNFLYKDGVIVYIDNLANGTIGYDKKIYIDEDTKPEDYDTEIRKYLNTFIDYEKYPNTEIKYYNDSIIPNYAIVYNDIQKCDDDSNCYSLELIFDEVVLVGDNDNKRIVNEFETKSNFNIPKYNLIARDRYEANDIYEYNEDRLNNFLDKNTDVDIVLPSGYTLEKQVFRSMSFEDVEYYCNTFTNKYYLNNNYNVDKCFEDYQYHNIEIPEFLDEYTPYEDNYIFIKDYNKYKYVGQTFSFDVIVHAKNGLGSFEYDLDYNDNYFELISGNTHVADVGNNETNIKYTYTFKVLKNSLLNNEYDFKILNANILNSNSDQIEFEIYNNTVKISNNNDLFAVQNEYEYNNNQREYSVYYILRHNGKVIYRKHNSLLYFPIIKESEDIWNNLNNVYNNYKNINIDFDTAIKIESKCSNNNYNYMQEFEKTLLSEENNYLNSDLHNNCILEETYNEVNKIINDNSLNAIVFDGAGGLCYPSNYTRSASLIKNIGNDYYSLGEININSTNVLNVKGDNLINEATNHLKNLLNDESINVSLKDNCNLVSELCDSCGKYVVSGDSFNNIYTVIDIVNDYVLESIEITNEDTYIDYEETPTLQLNIDVTPSNDSQLNFVYSSNNTVVASVSESGLITFIAPGNVTISVSRGDISDDITFVVVDSVTHELDDILNQFPSETSKHYVMDIIVNDYKSIINDLIEEDISIYNPVYTLNDHTVTLSLTKDGITRSKDIIIVKTIVLNPTLEINNTSFNLSNKESLNISNDELLSKIQNEIGDYEIEDLGTVEADVGLLNKAIAKQVYIKKDNEYYKKQIFVFYRNSIIEVPYNVRSESDLNTYLNDVFDKTVNISKNADVTYNFTQDNMGVYTIDEKYNLAVNREEKTITNLKINNNSNVTFDNINNTLKLNVSITPSDAIYEELTYETSDENVASVSDSGLITFKNSGSVTITVTNNDVSDSITFNVLNKESLNLVDYIDGNRNFYLFNDGSLYRVEDDIIVPYISDVQKVTYSSYDYIYYISDSNLYYHPTYSEGYQGRKLLLEDAKIGCNLYVISNSGKAYYIDYNTVEDLGLNNVVDMQYNDETAFFLTSDNKLYVIGGNVFGEKFNGGSYIDKPLLLLENVKEYGNNFVLTYDNSLYIWDRYASSLYEIEEKVSKLFTYHVRNNYDSFDTLYYYQNMDGEYKYLNYYASNKTIVFEDEDYVVTDIVKAFNNNYYLDKNKNLRYAEDGSIVAKNVKGFGTIYMDEGYPAVYITEDNKLYGISRKYDYNLNRYIYNNYLIMNNVIKVINGVIVKEDYTLFNSGYNYDNDSLGVKMIDDYVKYPAKVVRSSSEVVDVSDMFIYENTKKDISVNDKLDILGIVFPHNAKNKTIHYSVDNDELATIDNNGLLTAKKAGTVKVTASNYDNSISYSINVNIHDLANDIKFYRRVFDHETASYIYEDVGDSFNIDDGFWFYYRVFPEDSLDKGLNVYSTNENILKVSYLYNSSGNDEFDGEIDFKFVSPGDADLVIEFDNGNTITKTIHLYKIIEEVPSSPNIRISSSSGDGINIKWDIVDNASYYEIYRSTSINGNYTKLDNVNNNLYSDTSIQKGIMYYYKVKAVNDIGSSDYSNVVYDIIDLDNPVVSVSSIGASNIKLSWDKIEDCTGYLVYRSTDNKKWTKIATVKNPNTSYNNTSLSFNKNYYYKIRTYKTVNKTNIYSSYSEVVKAKTALGSSTLTTNKNTYNSLKLSWTKVSGASGYYIYKCSENYESCTKYKSTTSTSLTVSSLTLGEKYYFAIKPYKTVSKKKYYGSVTYSEGIVAPGVPSVSIKISNYKDVKLSWTSVKGANKYLIKYKDDISEDWISEETSELNYSINDLIMGHTYTFKVYSNYYTDSDLYSNAKTITSTLAPSAPKNVKASMQSYGKLLIDFDNVSDANSYIIYRSTSKTKGFKKYATVSESEFIDTSVTINKTYYYIVRSIVNGVSSKNSSTVSAKSYLKKPTISVKNNEYNSLKVVINSVSGATGYEIYRSTSKSSGYKKIKTTSSLEYINSSLSFNKTYYYKVRAYKTIGKKKYYSSYSSVVSNKTKLSVPVLGLDENLSWNKISGASNYEIYKCDETACELLLTTNELNYDSSLLDHNYSYKVRAYRVVSKKKYYSSYSNIVSFEQ